MDVIEFRRVFRNISEFAEIMSEDVYVERLLRLAVGKELTVDALMFCGGAAGERIEGLAPNRELVTIAQSLVLQLADI